LTYESYSAARPHLKDILDASESGRPVVVCRNSARSAMVDVDRLRYALTLLLPRAAAIAEGDGWSVFIPDTFIAADARSFDQAIDETIDALREYAEDWQDHLLRAPNHAKQWGLVQFVALSDDQQLRDWLTSEPE
jgi:hypothetical protein